MNEQERLAEGSARRHFEALQQAGLASWTFEEFFAFCAPLAGRAAVVPAIEAATCVTARELADAISGMLRTRYGRPLSSGTRNRIIRMTNHCLVARNRRRLRLTHVPR